MNLNIEIPDNLGAVVKAQAQAQGISLDHYVSSVLESTLCPQLEQQESGPPLEAGHGVWEGDGLAPSASEPHENRREMFDDFAKDFRGRWSR